MGLGRLRASRRQLSELIGDLPLGGLWPALVCMSLSLVTGLISPYFIKLVIDRALEGGQPQLLWMIGLAGVGIYVFHAWCLWGSRWWMSLAQERVHRALRARLFDRVLSLDLATQRGQAAGHWIAQVEADAVEIVALLTQVVPGLWSIMVQVLGTGVILAWMAPKLTLLAMLPLPIFVVLGWLFDRRVRPASRAHLEERTTLYGTLSQVFDGVEAVLTYGGKPVVQGWLDEDAQRVERAGLELARERARLFPALDLGISLLLLGVLLLGASQASRGELTVGTLAAYYFYIARTLSPVRGAPGIVFGWHRASAALDRASGLMRRPSWPPQAASLVALPTSPQELRLDAICFEYAGLATPALDQVALTLRPGQRVALLGPSGAGKSTLGRLIPRLMDPSQGLLRYGEQDIRDFEVEAWRARVGYVGQEVFLFKGTLRQNICFGLDEEVDPARFERAVKIAQVEALAQGSALGFEREVGQRGMGLSGGQRKRVALARALLREPWILVIDQLASELEQELNRAIFTELGALAQPPAILYLGHRLPEGFEADEVYRLEGGKLDRLDVW